LLTYLSHTITDNLTDDADIHREIRNLFVRTYYVADFTFYGCEMQVV